MKSQNFGRTLNPPRAPAGALSRALALSVAQTFGLQALRFVPTEEGFNRPNATDMPR